MNTSWLAKMSLIFLILLFPFQIFSQDLNVQKMIGKSINSVIKKYGKPVHQDRSNPEMKCVFYKTKTSQKTFVSNKDGVFQAEGSFCFKNYSKTIKSMNKLIAGCKDQGYRVDTLNNTKYILYGDKSRVNLSIFENSLSKEYEIKVKAEKSLGMK